MPLTAQNKHSTWERAISERGQTVIPKEIREYLDVKGGDSLQWKVNKEGEVVVEAKKRKSVMDLKGAVKAKFPIDDMDRVIRESKEERVNKKIEEGQL